ncbi:SMC-Scp complex subunit ScpB [Actinoplanes sp. NPDC049802]|uniref:SMC-Scp complex subunit ScpB n=1 Tax=Actinoplanes sp. NPDC049802 TaxID=3154742 RepID=UPI003400945A
MSSEERPESLAAQAAAWVPPWERRRPPDRDYQEAASSAEEAEPATIDLEPEPAPASEPEPEAAPAPEAKPAPAPELESEPVPEPAAEPAPPREPAPAPELESASEPAPAAEPAPAPESAPEPAPVSVPEPEPRIAVPTQPRRQRESDAPTRTPAVMDDAELAAALESIMLVVDEPVGELQLAQVLEQPVERIARTLEDVSARYTAAGHGIDLRRAAGGWRLYTRPEYAHYVERFVLDGQSVRLTQAALETLAVVAYKQPVTRSRISAIRGVNCDGVMRTLVTRGLIEECGTEPETGAYLYRTTSLFLEKLGLNSVDQLPPLAPFLPDDVEEVLDASG